MELEKMTLVEIDERLAALDEEVRAAEDEEKVNSAIKEKEALLARKAELSALEARKKTALELTEGKTEPEKIIDIRKGVTRGMNPEIFNNMTAEEVRATEEYRNAYMKRLMGKAMSEIEKRANEMGSTDVAGVMPTTTTGRIFDMLKVYAPLLSECTLFQIPGSVKIAVEGTNNAAALHTQNSAVTPATDTMLSVTLGEFEVMKVLRISATVANSSVGGFEQWLVDYLARGIGAKVGAYMIYGTGSSQPKGLDYGATWSDGSNAVDWAGAAPTPAELAELMGYLGAGYHANAKWLMNSSTFWKTIVPAQDDSKFKIISPNYDRIYGKPVVFDDNTAAGDIFFGDLRQGLVANLSQNVRVDRSADSGFLNNSIDYRGTVIFDCSVPHAYAVVKSAADLTAGA